MSVTAVMTDNGACYRSHVFAEALGEKIKHRWTRPYRPQSRIDHRGLPNSEPERRHPAVRANHAHRLEMRRWSSGRSTGC
ncbi:Putative uncharacterized protein [Propionibacterium freudenreichii]|nr:Putative uncharacterized protein [Propionibacterium freudenreichii]